ncbi:MAG TPA: hypothetical protein VNM66_02850, partial [Thermodesulfobacteriota bacterium]|nr:hypothetical protein [Thermodesulfobacteriota bacterium]
MILIGSPARGDRAAGSDADPVVPVDRHDRPGPFRGPESLPAEPVGMPLAPLGCTPEERRAGAPRS